MATEEELKSIEQIVFKSRPSSFNVQVDRSNLGIGLVLKYLSEVGHPVSAAQISRYMNVSTARVAVLLRTMTEKELIEKGFDVSDGRKVLVRLSQKGKDCVAQKQAEMMKFIERVADKIGVDRLKIFIKTLDDINEIVSGEMLKGCSSAGADKG